MANVLLLGSYGRGNVGDDLFLVALTKLLNKHKITANSAYDALLPIGVKNKISTISTISNKDFFKKLIVFIEARYIIYGGGDLWVDLYGARFMRGALWKMVLVNTIARMLGKKVVYIGCGCGDINGFSLSLARYSAKLAAVIIFRDETSMIKIRNDESTIVLPDVTITLPLDVHVTDRNETQTLGIFPLYYIPEPDKNYSIYLASMADLCCTAMDKGMRVRLVPMLKDEGKDVYDDVRVCNDIAKISRSRMYGADVSVMASIDSASMLAAIRDFDVCVATRLHGTILATWLNVPVIGVSYRPKVARFLTGMHLEKSVVDIDDTNLLISKFDECLLNSSAFKLEPEHLRALKKTAINQYRNILAKYVL